MVDVEVDDGDSSFESSVLLGVYGGEGDGRQQTESHGSVSLGVVSRRSEGAEGGVRLSVEDRVDGANRSAEGEVGGVEGFRRHERIGVDGDESAVGDGVAEGVEIVFVVSSQSVVSRRLWSGFSLGVVEVRMVEGFCDRLESLRSFGMAKRREVLVAARMAHQQQGHAGLSSSCMRKKSSARGVSGSTAYRSRSLTPQRRRNESSMRKFPLKVLASAVRTR